MSIVRRSPAITIGGRKQNWCFPGLRDTFGLIGFDPSADGDEWALIATDLHCYYEGGSAIAAAFDSRIVAECAALESYPPSACLILGDVCTGLSGSFGAPIDPVDGTLEAAAADAALTCFSDLADTHLILGNHDTAPLEDPLGAFLAANCPGHFSDLHHSLLVGGVRIVLLSTSHDGAFVDGQDDYLASQLAKLVPNQECVIGFHQPSGGRAYEHHALIAAAAVIPIGMQNRLWKIGGHNHRFNSAPCYSVAGGSTTLASWEIGAAGGSWLTFGDHTNPALAAIACRGGRVLGRFAWDGKERLWHLLPDFNRSSPIAIPGQLDGVSGLTVLASYLEGFYDRTGRFNNSPSYLTYRIAGTWVAYCYDVQVNFPLPSGATKFWYVTTASPTTLSMSDDGSSWQAVSPIPALTSSALVVDIPVDLRSAEYLHVRAQSSIGHHISAWGFA